MLSQGYVKSKLRLTKTNHFELKVEINGTRGRFILDTGASNSCIGFEAVDRFGLHVEDSEVVAAGAGAIDMETKTSRNNKIRIGKWRKDKITLILFDLTHVNTALSNHNSEQVDGIIGADLLRKGQAVIDYASKYVFLRP